MTRHDKKVLKVMKKQKGSGYIIRNIKTTADIRDVYASLYYKCLGTQGTKTLRGITTVTT